MPFQGDVGQIPLSNILQALVMNGQEGVLTVEAQGLRRKIRVLKKGLRLLNIAQDTPDLLKHLLVKQKICTESQFQNIFSAWEMGSSYPGDFLVTRRIVTKEMVRTDILHQIENEMMEIITTPSLKYEFSADEDGSLCELFNPATLGDDLLLNTNAMLMETVRRDDEWRRIREVIPSPSEVFVVADKASLSAKNLEVNPHCLKQLKPLLGGEYTVERVVALTTLSSFEVHETLYKLRGKGLIRSLNLDEKAKLAEKFRRSLRVDEAAEIYRSILDCAPADRETRLKLIGILEKKKERRGELVEHYIQLGLKLAQEDSGRAETFLKKALEITPYNLAALELIFNVHRSKEDHREALTDIRGMLAAAKSSRGEHAAVDLVYKAINFYPDEAGFFHELADIHVQQGQTDAAVECLKTVASLYEARKDFVKLRKAMEEIGRLKPGAPIQLKRYAAPSRPRGRPQKGLLRLVALSLLVFATLGVLVVMGISEYYARNAFAQVAQDVRTHRSFGNLLQAKFVLEEFQKTFPLTTCMKSAQDLLSEVNRDLTKQREDASADKVRRRVNADSSYTQARLALDNNDYGKAHEILQGLDLEALDAEQAKEAAARRDGLNKYFREAEAILKQAEAADGARDYAKSHALRRELLQKYGQWPGAKDVLLPVVIETLPPGADLILEKQVVGRTPMVLRVQANRMPPAVLSKMGYQPADLASMMVDGVPLKPLSSHRIQLKLVKKAEWEIDAEAPIEGFPVAIGDNVCFGTRSGKIFCVKQESGEIVWTYSIPQSMDFAGGIALWRNRVYFGSFDGKVYTLNSADGKQALDPVPASQELLPIKLAPSAPSERGTIAVNCDRRLLAGVSLDSGRVSWTLPFATAQVLGQPQSLRDKVYVVTTAGELLEIDQDTGKIEKRMELGFETALPGRLASNGQYLIGNPQGKLLSIDLKVRQVVWAYECGEALACPPFGNGDLAVAVTATGKLLCLSSTGEAKWTHSTRESFHPESGAVEWQGKLILGSQRGVVVCVDLPTGRLVWDYRTRGAREKEPKGILSRGTVENSRLFVGSEDHFLYCLSVE